MRLLIVISIGCCVFSSSVFSQDWKTQYDQAVRLYQEENYEESLNAAQKAYPIAKQGDSKSVAFTLQLITANFLQVIVSEEALSYSEEETTLFLQLEGEKSKNYAEALKKQLQLYFGANKISEAYSKSDKTVAVCKDVFGENSYDYAVVLSLAAQVAIASNQLSKGKEQLDASLLLLEKNPEAGEDFLNALSMSADLDVRQNAKTAAVKKYTQLIRILEQNGLQSDPLYVDAKKKLDQLKISSGGVADASAVIAGGTQDASLLAQSYLKLAIDFQLKGDVVKAFDHYDLAKKAVADGELSDKTAFSIFLNSSRYALEKGRLDLVKQDILEAKTLDKQLFTSDQAEHQIVELTEADYLLQNGDAEKATLIYSSVAAHLQQNATGIPPSFILSSSKRLLNIHQTESAMQLLRILSTNKQMIEADQLTTAVLYSDALLRSGKPDEAISYLQNGIEKSSALKVSYQVQLADIQRSRGAWNEALVTLTKIETSALSAKLQGEIAYQKARLHHSLGQFREAEQFYRSAITNGQNGIDKGFLQQVQNSFATFYTTIGNYSAAENAYEELLADKTLDEDFRVTVFQNLATVYQQTLRYKEAQGLLEQVVLEDAIRLGENDPDYAMSLQNLATVYQRLGDSQKAVQLYTKALAIDERVSGTESILYATKAANLGIAKMELGDLKGASENLSKALRIRETILGKEHPDYVFNEYNMAVLYQRQQRPELALPLYKHVSAFYVKQIAELFPALSEKEKTAYYNKISEVVQAYMDFAIEQSSLHPVLVADLLDFRLATKALLLNSSTKIRNTILSGNDPDLKKQFTQWLQIKEELGKLYTQNLDSKNQNKIRIESLQKEVNEIEKQLSTKSEMFAKSTERVAGSWQQLKTKLKPEEVAIEMIRLRLNYKNDSVIYAALVIRSDWDQPRMIIFPNGKSMEGKEFKYYRNSTRFNVVNERSYSIYWQPLEKLVSKATTVYFSSDGVYNKINLTSLFNKNSNQYLIDQCSFSMLSNLKELSARDEQVTVNHFATLVGFPDFGFSQTTTTKSTLRSIVGTDFQALPGTKVEVERIAALLREQQWKVNEYVSQEASEEKLKTIGNTGVLHIATHGFFIADGDGNAPVVFTENLEQIANNPLLRSGLILSGAAKGGNEADVEKEDGILTAYEAISLPLENTHLVILSACETGQGEVRNGEGVYGLQRAILLAGARHLLMSLWKVDDEATQELMTEFYKQWLSTNDIKVAYRNAQLAIKTKYEMPQYWAGFVLLGI